MALQATNLSYSYPKGPQVLSAITCAIEPGSITTIVGPNGAGKSTLLRLLAGLITPDGGQVTIDSTSVHTLSADKRASRIAYIAQRSSLAFDFDVRRVVTFGRLARPADDAAVERALDHFELTELASKPMGTLSVGQQQRVSLARAFAQLDGLTDAYLLADEPTSAMDPKHQIDTLEALRERARADIGIVLVAHDLSHASRCADRVILLNARGSLVADGPANEVLIPATLESVFSTPFAQGEVHGNPIIIPATQRSGSDTIQHA